MQKLRFINGNGVEVDFTSGNFGIVNWSGFSETELNIQTQQVPFQDGSVFLDALIQDRVINVTLAINDEKNLEKRYELRRQIISLMNPKLGLGKLIYQNDIFQRQIECIPQLPVFPTKNFNNGGTLKVSLSFSCPSPYWEDVEETVVKLKLGQRNIVENKGDIQTNIDAEIITTSVENPVLRNLTSDAKIELIGNYDRNIHIDTNLGRKQIFIENENLYSFGDVTNNLKICYSDDLELFVIVGYNGKILYSSDGVTWGIGLSDITSHIIDIIYSEELHLFVAITSTRVLTSSDGMHWSSSSNLGIDFNSITYSEELHLFVIATYGNQILYSSDGIDWISIYLELDDESYDINSNSITYSEELHLFVSVGAYGRNIRSTDGINWTIGNTIENQPNLNSIIYNSELHSFISVGNNGVMYTSTDGIHWEYHNTDISFNFSQIIYSVNLNLFVFTANNGKIFTSKNLIDFNSVEILHNYDNLKSVVYSEYLNLFIIVGDNGQIITSNDGVNFQSQRIINTSFNSITYSEELHLFVAVGDNGTISYSSDGKNWTYNNINVSNYFNSITYSEELHLFVVVGSRGIVLTSSDGKNWTVSNCGVNTSLKQIIYINSLHLFVTISPNIILTSTDGIDWSSIDISSLVIDTLGFNSITYSEELHLFVVINWNGQITNIIRTSDLTTWEVVNIEDYNFVTINSITYSEELHLFVAVGNNESLNPITRIITSTDGVTWTITNLSEFNGFVRLKNVTYSEELHLFVAVGDAIVISTDGKNWRTILNSGYYKSVITHNNIYIVGMIDGYIDFENDRNIIEDIDENSNMNFNLIPGDNELMISYKTGTALALLKFRNKYLGV